MVKFFVCSNCGRCCCCGCRPEVAQRNSVSFNLPPSTSSGNGGGGVAAAGGGRSADYRQMYDTCSDILNSFQKHVNNNNR